jgi:hypothetical protein
MVVWINHITGFQASRIPLILATSMMFLILTCSYCGFQGSQT